MIVRLLFLIVLVPIHAFASCESQEGWALVEDDEGVKIYHCKPEESPIYAVRGIAEIKAPLDKIFAAIKDVKTKKEWVRYLVESKIIKPIGKGIDNIQYALASPPWPISKRDAVVESRNHIRAEDQEVIIENRSVELPEVPVKPGIIRISIKFSRTMLKPIANGSHTRIIVEAHADPKGWIPIWIVNYLYKSWPKRAINDLTKQATRSNLEVPEKIKSFLSQLSIHPENLP